MIKFLSETVTTAVECLISRSIRQTPMCILNFYLLIIIKKNQYILFAHTKNIDYKKNVYNNRSIPWLPMVVHVCWSVASLQCSPDVSSMCTMSYKMTGNKMLILYFQSLGTFPVSIHPCYMIHALEWTRILVWGHLIQISVHSWTDRHDWL